MQLFSNSSEKSHMLLISNHECYYLLLTLQPGGFREQRSVVSTSSHEHSRCHLTNALNIDRDARLTNKSLFYLLTYQTPFSSLSTFDETTVCLRDESVLLEQHLRTEQVGGVSSELT